MPARLQSFLLHGIDALPCEVEVDLDPDDEQKRELVVGLPDAAVRESIERVRSALANCGYMGISGRLLVNLAPAAVRKEGPLYDLPIAVGVLMTQGIVPSQPTNGAPDLRRMQIAGELALDGRVRPIRGAIAMAAMAAERGCTAVIVPAENAAEAAVVEAVEVYGVRTLSEVVGILAGLVEPARTPPPDVAAMLQSASATVDFAEVRGQEAVKRAITVAAAGSHNVLLLGPAGTGKTMMAKALPGVLPPLTGEEAIQISRIYSAAGQLPSDKGLILTRPVRSPHHTASAAAVVGGGAVPRPGEVSLAQHGVLFLDELPEFPRQVLETLRQPLEDHVVTISRSHSSVRFPADFMLVAALNPTPKGDMPAGAEGQRAMQRYLSRISGPLLDRIDIHVEAPAVPWDQLTRRGRAPGTSSAEMREHAAAARERQKARQGPFPNARLRGKDLDKLAPMDDDAHTVLGQAMTELGLSARAYDKIRRVARTLADLEGEENLRFRHVSEAVQYRLLDRQV